MASSRQSDSLALLNRLHETTFSKPKHSYPSISSIPRTSPARLAAASSESPSPSSEATSVLYLAYGSNLSAETFLGARGIRPISQTNVSAPALSLIFDLPGLPYREPCFANTTPRKVPQLPDPSDPPKLPPVPPLPQPPAATADVEKGTITPTDTKTKMPPDLGWSKGLYGVVYEVTPQDYATIVATEGGGSSYLDILTPCIPPPPRVSVPEKPPIDIPRPFFAHTLYSPAIPDAPDDDDDKNPKDGDDDKEPPADDPRKKWYYHLITPPRRPDPTYAQPSARYLKLIADGAAEHELPDDCQAWLRSLQPYTVTSCRQQLAQWLLTGIFFPVMLLFFQLNKWVANKEGKVPLWLGVSLSVVFNMLWMGYDAVLKPVFGDGERTEEEEEEENKRWRRAPGTEAEKMNLLMRDW
ncbi:gliotoxin biosynthesis protein [Colletotrichum kahawae]|uniref:gamma-glutamylcyclotransferase n=1 Tax=Colletotrichum kahawae TaxID=34407 RepID=A0AAD9Y693_COLKA|nr:gliotoxin biosynthesis protein [Colletotrichum kahawae]